MVARVMSSTTNCSKICGSSLKRRWLFEKYKTAQGTSPFCNPLQLNLIVDFRFLAVLREVEFLDVGSETGREVAEVHG